MRSYFALFALVACGSSDGNVTDSSPSLPDSEPTGGPDATAGRSSVPQPPPASSTSSSGVPADAGAPADASSSAESSAPTTPDGACFAEEDVGEGTPVGINTRGQIAGNRFVASPDGGGSRAFLWTDGVRVDLPTLNGDAYAHAIGLNDRGDVVGTSAGHAVLWRDGQAIDIGAFGGDWSTAGNVNEAGHVAGISALASGGSHAFLWRGSDLEDLGTLPGDAFSASLGIDDRGDVLIHSAPSGSSADKQLALWQSGTLTPIGHYGVTANLDARGRVLFDRDDRAYLWSAGTLAEVRPFEDATKVSPRAMTKDGVVLGHATRGNADVDAFAWKDGATARIGPSFTPLGANPDLLVSGYSESAGKPRAAVWKAGKLVHLAPAEALGSHATAVNAAGQAVGQVTLASGTLVKRWSTSTCFP